MKNYTLFAKLILLVILTSCAGIIDAQTTINSSPITEAVAGDLYTYTVQATGTPASMQYSLITAPDGMSINQTSGLISWTPASNNVDSYVQVKADNGSETPDIQSFWIFIAAPAECEESILALFRLNETEGPGYEDFIGGHDATASAAPTATVGKIDGGQLFDDDTKFIIPDHGNEWEWAAGSSFSVECWVKTSVDTKTQAYVSRYNPDPDVREISTAWWLGQNEEGNAALEIKDFTNHNSVLVSTANIANGQWHHVVGVRNGTTQHNKIYVDGVEKADMEAELPGGLAIPLATPVTLGYMKRTYDWDPEYHLNGTLDEVAFYTRALSTAEIAALYNEGLPEGHCGPGNFAPVITSSPIITAFTDVSYTYNFTVEDIVASDVITLSAVTKPSWLNFNFTPGQKSATLTGTPSSENIGDDIIILRVNDGHMTKDQVFTIAVQSTNHTPVVTSSPQTTIDEDAVYNYSLTVTDEDISDVITMAVVTKPTWLTFSWIAGSKTATLSGTPGDNDSGDHPVDISISDEHVTIHNTFTVNVVAVNDPPVITSEPEEEAYVGLNYSYIFTATDVDNETITKSVVEKPDWLSFSNSTGILSGTPALSDKGSQVVALRASDGSLYDDQYIVITVYDASGLNDLETAGIHIYPVPAKDFLIVEFESIIEETRLEIINSTGSIIKSAVIPENQNYVRIDLGNIGNGTYFLYLKNSSHNNIGRIAVVR